MLAFGQPKNEPPVITKWRIDHLPLNKRILIGGVYKCPQKRNPIQNNKLMGCPSAFKKTNTPKVNPSQAHKKHPGCDVKFETFPKGFHLYASGFL